MFYKENDSIRVKSIYYSRSAYDFSSDKFLSEAVNKYYKDSIPAECEIVLSVYFYYVPDSGTVQKPKAQEFVAMENKLHHLSKKNVIILDPIEWKLYPLIHW